MTTLNKLCGRDFKKYGIHACTDITGFGLLVHLGEMLGETFPQRCGFTDSLYQGVRGLCGRILHHSRRTAQPQPYRCTVAFENCSLSMEEILFDPQTFRGLLVAIPENEAKKALKEIEALGLDCGIIGRVTEKKEKKIYVLK